MINILLVVDTQSALSDNTLLGNVYLIDNNGYLGSWQQGTDTLHTVIEDGQTVSWSVASVAPSNDVSINGFSGAMTENNICKPEKQTLSAEPSWLGRIESGLSIGQYDYTISLELNGKQLSVSPYLKVV